MTSCLGSCCSFSFYKSSSAAYAFNHKHQPTVRVRPVKKQRGGGGGIAGQMSGWQYYNTLTFPYFDLWRLNQPPKLF